MEDSIVVSGAVGITIMFYKNKRYILFGDRHYSQKGICTNKEHFTVDEIIRYLTNETNETNDYKDVYIETHYTKKLDLALKYLTFEQKLFMGGMAQKSVKLENEKARYHYVDVRNLTSIYLKLIDPMLLIHLDPENIKRMNDGNEKLEYNVNIIFGKILFDVLYGDYDIKNCLIWDYIKMCYESDNIHEDHENWLLKVFGIANNINLDNYVKLVKKRYNNDLIMCQKAFFMIKSRIAKLLPFGFKSIMGKIYIFRRRAGESRKTPCLKNIVSERYGLSVHKIRLQLLELERQGDISMAENIRNHCYTEMSKFNVTKFCGRFNILYEHWKHLMLKITPATAPIKKLFSINSFRIISPVSMEIHLMDAYALARMFRSFNNSDHFESSDVICLFGEAHNKNISNFFSKLGATVYKYKGEKPFIRSILVPEQMIL